MKEQFLNSIASAFRSVPHFRGKHRTGRILERILLKPDQWKQPERKIRLKGNFNMFVDVRSKTNHGAFWTGNYDTELIKKFTTSFREDWVVLDVGANIGYYSVPFAYQLQKLNGRLFSFEPVSINFNTLVRNINLNKLDKVVTASPIALGNQKGTIELSLTEKGSSSNAHILAGEFSNTNVGRKETAPMERLDDFMKANAINRCDFIKVDIEGAEIFFIQGAIETIKAYKPIIYGEFNAFFLKKFGHSMSDIWNILKPLGYRCYQQSNHGAHFTPTEPVTGSENLLLIPEYTESII